MRSGCIQRRTIADETVTNSDTAGNVETGRAAVVLTNDLTPVWTIAFDEIRIISVGACQCKCHTYIQLPLVTLRSTAGHDTNQVTLLFHRVSLPARSPNRESPSHFMHESRSARGVCHDTATIICNGVFAKVSLEFLIYFIPIHKILSTFFYSLIYICYFSKSFTWAD